MDNPFLFSRILVFLTGGIYKFHEGEHSYTTNLLKIFVDRFMKYESELEALKDRRSRLANLLHSSLYWSILVMLSGLHIFWAVGFAVCSFVDIALWGAVMLAARLFNRGRK